MMVSDAAGDKQYFAGMIDEVRARLAHLADDSPIRRCFPEVRLAAIGVEVEATSAESLVWGHRQPAFLFVQVVELRASDARFEHEGMG